MTMPRVLALLPLLLLCTACPSGPTSGSNASTPAKSPAPAEPSPTAPTDAEPTVSQTPPPSVEPAPPETVAEVAAGFNAFGLELYREVATTPGDQVISPASVAMALAMTHAGARGPSATEIEAALHMTRPVADVQAAVATMLVDWNTPREGAELTVANRLFGDAKVAYRQPFLDLTKFIFGAPLEPVDFRGAHEAARVRINEWVEAQTHDRIEDLLPVGSVDPSTRLVLVNAIYFKSQWMSPFPEHRTAPAPFLTAEGPHDVPTMRVTEHLRLTKSDADGVELVDLPYADPSFSMTLIVPTAKDGLAAVEAGLTAQKLSGWIAALQGERVELWLPKFRIAPAEGLRLSGVLAELGIRTVFSAQADLTGIALPREQLQLAEAYHKGFIAVDEKGTEAAAATAMAARAGSMPPRDEPRVVKVDRPFLYVIRDTRSGLVMFIGRVALPKTEG